VATDLVLKILQEMRAEAKESRDETRDNFSNVFHRLALAGTGISSLRDEMKESRQETRENFGKVFHRLAVLEGQMGDVRNRVGSLEGHMAGLLASMPATSERIDKLEARLAALEVRGSSQ
jgi:chromosome segregation ATPase